jgi:hypothetical protein
MKNFAIALSFFLLAAAHAATVKSVPTTELGEPSMLGRYNEGRAAEVLVAAIPRAGALDLWVIVQSTSNYSLSYNFPLGQVTSLDGVLQVGQGKYEILVGVNGVPESLGFDVDVSDALLDLASTGCIRASCIPTRSTIEVERFELTAADSAEEATQE